MECRESAVCPFGITASTFWITNPSVFGICGIVDGIFVGASFARQRTWYGWISSFPGDSAAAISSEYKFLIVDSKHGIRLFWLDSAWVEE